MPHKKNGLWLHAGLPKAQKQPPHTKIRSGKIGLAAFLHKHRVDFSSS